MFDDGVKYTLGNKQMCKMYSDQLGSEKKD